MQLDNLKIKYDVENDVSYINIEPDDPKQINEYLLQMLTQNKIQGLLPLHKQSIDGKVLLRYELGNIQRISDVLTGEHLEANAKKMVFKSILETQKLLPEYFISEEHCVFKNDYVFMDNRYCVKMICLPLALPETKSADNLKSFLLWMTKSFFTDERGVSDDPYISRIVQAVSCGNPTVEQLCSLVECDSEVSDVITDGNDKHADADTTQKKQGIVNDVTPESLAGAKKKLEKKLTDIVENVKENIDLGDAPEDDNFGFKIPGMTSDDGEENGKKKKKEKKEKKEVKQDKAADKKSSLLQGLLSSKSKKEKEDPEPQDTPADEKRNSDDEGRFDMTVDGNSRWEVTVYHDDAKAFNGTTVMRKVQFKGKTVEEENEEKKPVAKLVYEGRKIEINSNPFSIGKVPCDMVLNGKYVSHNHARISYKDGVYFIEDLNSKNRTYIDNVAIVPYTKCVLHDQAKISIADKTLQFIIED